MSVLFLSPPGTVAGPCKDFCSHPECADTRRMATTPCASCKQPIGYSRRFFQTDDWSVLTHMTCENVSLMTSLLPRENSNG